MAVVSLKNKVYSRSALAGNVSANTPRSIANLRLWLDAADVSTISATSNDVTQWTDKSGNSYAFTQGTSSKRPKSGTRTHNSLNVIDFDGTDDILTSNASASTWKFFHDGTEYTIFVAAVQDNQNNGALLSTNSGSFGNVGAIHLLGATKSLSTGVATGNGSVRVIDTGTATDFADLTTFSYASWTLKPSNATASERVAFRWKNGTASKPNTNTGAVSTSDPSQTLSIGHTETFLNIPLNGAIGEIIVYTSALSDSNRATIDTYLRNKWGIQ
jgi:hypothetical protein